MRFSVVSLFPDMFASLTENGVTGRAFRQEMASLLLVNPRDFTRDVHRTVDDRPYGGGPGMVMLAEPLLAAVEHARDNLARGSALPPKVVYVSPQGRTFNQALAQEQVSDGRPIVFMAGRYEGIDERIIETVVDEEWSLGDFVLSGGELPVMAMLDAMIRLLPGALGHKQSAEQDSFVDNLLDCPHYTRPEVYAGKAVPEVLLSGNHERIRRWRLQQSLGRTWQRRPELLESRSLTAEEAELLAQYQADCK